MERIKLVPGEVCLWEKQIIIIKSLELVHGKVWVDFVGSNDSKLLHIRELKSLPLEQDRTNSASIIDKQDLGQPEVEKWDKAHRKAKIVQAVEINANKALTLKENRKSVREIAKSYGCHYSTIYRHMRLYHQSGREVRSLIEKTKGGKGKRRLKPEIEKILHQAVENIYLTLQRNTIAATYQEVKRLCYRSGIKDVPGLNTLNRRIKDLPQATVVLRRDGEKKYREIFRISQGTTSSELEVPYPLATVEIDHTEVDLQLIDEFYGEKLGRPYLTIAVDVYSRIVLGFYLSFDPPSTDSIAQCIAHVICPKEEWLQRRGIDVQWPCWGNPDRFRVDNAMEFHSKAYKRACDNYDIKIQYRKQVEDGAIVERLIGTCMKHVRPIRGATSSNVQEKGEYKSEKEATMALKGFEKWFIYWVIEYNDTKHDSLGTSPLNKYLTDTLHIRLDFSPFVERTIQRKGVVIDHIYYLDPCFRWYREEDPNQKHIFRRLPGDISTVWLFDKVRKEYIPIKYANVNYPAISLWELKAVRKRLIDQQIPVDEETIFRCVEAERAVVLDEISNRKNIRLTVATNRIMGQLYLPPHIDNSRIEVKAEIDLGENIDEMERIDGDDDIRPLNFLPL